MSTKQDHINFINEKGTFTVRCSHAIFSIEQIELLEKYGHWFMALTNGELEPITDMQKEFILVAKREKKAVSPEEIAWNKYLYRKEMEDNPNNRLNIRYEYEEDTFCSREMLKQTRKILSRELINIHKREL